jgi:hypothetical protein
VHSGDVQASLGARRAAGLDVQQHLGSLVTGVARHRLRFGQFVEAVPPRLRR